MNTPNLQRPIGFSPQEISALINEEVVALHAEDAAFLWVLRDAAVTAPNYSLQDLADLDERVEANIDGLRVAGDFGWKTCSALVDQAIEGSVFAAGVLAIEGRNSERINFVYRVVEADKTWKRELISAFGWVDPSKLQGKVEGLLISKSPFWRSIGIAACAVHRVDPGKHLNLALVDADYNLRARGLRTAGELGRQDLAQKLLDQLGIAHDGCRFWAAWSSVLLGKRGRALKQLTIVAESDSPYRERGMQLLLRVLAPKDAMEWLKGLAKHADWHRYVALGAGIAGNPAYIPWLIKQMAAPELARVAGESFSMITGVDLAYKDLDGEWPEGFEAGPTESPEDGNVEIDSDEDLPWPDPELITKWWSEHQDKFKVGTRYLRGKAIGFKSLQDTLVSGSQRERARAALELAIRSPNQPLFEVCAPGSRQLAQL